MPEASFADLQTAIAGFNDQVKSYAVQSAVTNASQRVQELQGAQMDEMDKRNQLQQLSGQLALQLTGLGASGAQIQGAVGATQPKPLDNYGQMYAEGLTTGSEKLKKNATELQKFMNANPLELMRLKQQQQNLNQQSKQDLVSNKDFQKLVPKVQEQYNRSVKGLNEKIGQLDLVSNLDPGSPRDRIQLSTLVKSVGQDVGNIGEKEADASLGATAAGQFTQFKNYITGTASTVQTPEQAKAVAAVLKKAKPMLQKISAQRARQYAYQLTKSAGVYGHKMNLEEAQNMLVEPSFGQTSAEQSTTPGSSSLPDVRAFLTPIK